MTTSVKDELVEKLEQLPEEALREVADFVDFLKWRSDGEEDAVLRVAGSLSGDPVSAKAIEAELYASKGGG